MRDSPPIRQNPPRAIAGRPLHTLPPSLPPRPHSLPGPQPRNHFLSPGLWPKRRPILRPPPLSRPHFNSAIYLKCTPNHPPNLAWPQDVELTRFTDIFPLPPPLPIRKAATAEVAQW